MRRLMACLSLFIMASCGGNDQKAAQENIPAVALGKSANSDAFNRSFGQLMDSYYDLKDDFIDENNDNMGLSANNLMISADSLKLDELKGDSSILSMARTYTMDISSESKGLLGENTLEGKRKELQIISDQLYDLIRTVAYDRAVIYHVYCPTAFNDQGAYWLSNSRQIRNPYTPKKMMGCGEVKDSIDIRK